MERRRRYDGAAYYGLTTAMDRMIQQILERLEANGLADNTLVVYASDHGDQLGERGLWWKQTFHEHSIKVPLIMRWAGRLPAGERRSQVVNLLDLASTIVDAAGAPALPQAQGRSFLAVVYRRSGTIDEQIYSDGAIKIE